MSVLYFLLFVVCSFCLSFFLVTVLPSLLTSTSYVHPIYSVQPLVVSRIRPVTLRFLGSSRLQDWHLFVCFLFSVFFTPDLDFDLFAMTGDRSLSNLMGRLSCCQLCCLCGRTLLPCTLSATLFLSFPCLSSLRTTPLSLRCSNLPAATYLYDITLSPPLHARRQRQSNRQPPHRLVV